MTEAVEDARCGRIGWRELWALVMELPDDSALTRAVGGHRLTDVILDCLVSVVSAHRAEFIAANSKPGTRTPKVVRLLESLHPKPAPKMTIEGIAASFGVFPDPAIDEKGEEGT